MLFAILFMCTMAMVMPALHAQETYGQPESPLVAEVLATEIHTADPEEMKYVILSRLLEPYAAEHSIEVSQADIDAYINAMQRVAEQDRQRRAQQRDELVRQLASADLDGAEHAALSAELETLDQFAEFAVSLPASDSR